MLRSLRSFSLVLATAGLVLAPAAVHAAPAHAAAKKTTSKKKTSKKKASKKVTYPSVSKVAPLKAGIGDKLVLKGKSFRSGKNKNFVVFKRSGGRALFVKAEKATTKQITVTIPAKLLTFLLQKDGAPIPTRFALRVMSSRLAKSYTKTAMSPLISATSSAVGPSDDCDADGVTNSRDTDDDNDLLSDVDEARIGTDACKRDSDGDGMSDGWEQQSAIDRNGGSVLPSPAKRPYPNALNKDDAAIDADGDGLTNLEEYTAWATFGNNKFPLSYSGGNPTSAGRTPVTGDEAIYFDRDRNGYLSDFERDADGDGISNMDEMRTGMDLGAITKSQSPDDDHFYDYGIFTSKYIELAEKATETVECAGINQVPFYCVDKANPPIDVQKVDTLDWLSVDTDGDSQPDGVDDVDHDDVSNIDEYHTFITTSFKRRKYDPLDACVPNANSRFCLLGGVDVDGDGVRNEVDIDDDGDFLADTDEIAYGLNPLVADTDRDGVSDGFEFFSAKDLNSAALPYPGKRPYPNPLDGSDGDADYDGDSLTLREESKAWQYTYCHGAAHCAAGLPLTYSDGTQFSGGRTAASGALADLDEDRDGYISDDEKDVDGDYLSNYVEAHGPMSGPAWWDGYVNDPANKCTTNYIESTYPGPKYAGTDFVDPDTDGDGLVDGKDDVDHDGYSNWFESWRPSMVPSRNYAFGVDSPSLQVFEGHWCLSYTSVGHTAFYAGDADATTNANALARVQPFNPCKPTNSDYCHRYVPPGYYPAGENWLSDVDGTVSLAPGVEPWT